MKTSLSRCIVVIAVVGVMLLSACAAWLPAEATLAPGGERTVHETVIVEREGIQVTQREGAVRHGTPLPQSTATPPMVPVYGGEVLPNDEPFDSMFFEHYGVNPFIDTEDDPLSTFAMDVDTASYTLARRYVSEGHLPPEDAVRVEEFVNYFDLAYPSPEEGDGAFAIHL
jgi:Ca-activated chloride channel homolog